MQNYKSKFKIFNFSFLIFNSWRSQVGFTLIELLVSIAVIVLLLGLTIAGYSRFNLRQNLLSAGQTMKNILRDAQSRSYTGEIDCALCDCTPSSLPTLVGWYVDFGNKKIFGRCGGTNFSEKAFGLPTDIVINVTPASSLLFRANPPAASHQATICLSSQNLPNTFYKIIVTASGEISESGVLVTICS